MGKSTFTKLTLFVVAVSFAQAGCSSRKAKDDTQVPVAVTSEPEATEVEMDEDLSRAPASEDRTNLGGSSAGRSR